MDYDFCQKRQVMAMCSLEIIYHQREMNEVVIFQNVTGVTGHILRLLTAEVRRWRHYITNIMGGDRLSPARHTWRRRGGLESGYYSGV